MEWIVDRIVAEVKLAASNILELNELELVAKLQDLMMQGVLLGAEATEKGVVIGPPTRGLLSSSGNVVH